MRAVVYTETGDPGVLRMTELDEPDPAPGEVRVALTHSGVNPTDWKSRQGSSAGGGLAFEHQVPNQDGAGVIDAVGAGVDPYRIGQRVWVWEAAYQRPGGTAQDKTVVPQRQAVTLPDDIPLEWGAAIGIPFMTAHRCLTVAESGPARLGPGALLGRTVLVAGGAGAVGNAAIQLARWAGATVITTVSSPDKAELATRAGAHHCLDYRQEDVAARVAELAPQGVDVVVEVAPGANSSLDAAVIAPNGVVAIYANNGGDDMNLAVRASMGHNVRWQFVLVYTEPDEAKHEAIGAISAALEQGAVRIGDGAGIPIHHFPLARTAEAHAAVERAAVGKVIVDIR